MGALLGVLAQVGFGANGASPEVQPTAIQPHPGEAVAAHAAAAATAALLARAFPWSGLALLLACALSAWVQSRGGSGWIARLIPRQVGHNAILWGSRPLAGRDRPCLLVVAPHDGGPPRPRRFDKAIPLLAAPGVLACAGLAVAPVLPHAGGPLLAWSALGFGAVALGGLAHRLAQPLHVEPGPAAKVLLSLAQALRDRPLANLDLVLAFLAGGAETADSLEVLLRNHRDRLDPELTRVLLLQPDLGPPAFAAREEWIRPRAADPLLTRAAGAAGLPETAQTTAAARASLAGWRSGALLAGSAEALAPTQRILDALDAAAGEGRW